MTVAYYRTNDLTRWGAGLGRDLYKVEVDLNFWGLDQRVTELEARPLPSTIEDFEVSGTTFYIHLDNSASYGPYELPVARYNPTGEWQATYPYNVMDTFTENGILYEVMVDHTSDTTFDAGENDGSGHDYYSVMLEPPGNSLPTGGATGQILTKSSGTNYAVTWSWKLPDGVGNEGKFLRQMSNTQDDAEFVTPDASEIGFTPVTSSPLTGITTVDDALESLASGAAAGVALSELTDVLFATGEPLTGQFIWFDGTDWIPTAEPNADGDLLQWDGNEWAPVSWLSVRRDDTVVSLASTGPISLDPTDGDVFALGPASSLTINAASAPAGARITIVLTTINTTTRTITFGTNFKSQGTLATGVVSGAVFTISFIGNGTNMNEVSRTIAM